MKVNTKAGSFAILSDIEIHVLLHFLNILLLIASPVKPTSRKKFQIWIWISSHKFYKVRNGLLGQEEAVWWKISWHCLLMTRIRNCAADLHEMAVVLSALEDLVAHLVLVVLVLPLHRVLTNLPSNISSCSYPSIKGTVAWDFWCLDCFLPESIVPCPESNILKYFQKYWYPEIIQLPGIVTLKLQNIRVTIPGNQPKVETKIHIKIRNISLFTISRYCY